jgi:hypothetical protein
MLNGYSRAFDDGFANHHLGINNDAFEKLFHGANLLAPIIA